MNSKHHPFTIERSSAKYFHGREEELNLFEGLLHETVYKRIGCSLLIQGPPGVGKSVLLDQCKQRAKKNNWHIVNLTNESFYNEREFFRQITEKKDIQNIEKSVGLDLKVLKMNIASKLEGETNYIH